MPFPICAVYILHETPFSMQMNARHKHEESIYFVAIHKTSDVTPTEYALPTSLELRALKPNTQNAIDVWWSFGPLAVAHCDSLTRCWGASQLHNWSHD